MSRLLGPEYFDGSRLLDFKKALELFNNELSLISKSNRNGTIIFDEDFKENQLVLNNIRAFFPGSEVNLLFWTKRVTYIMEPNNYVIRYPVGEDLSDVEDTQTYVISIQSVTIFMMAKMYCDSADNDMYRRLCMYGSGDCVTIRPPPCRERVEDGQLKIMTTVVLAVDDVKFVDGDNILVIGSSSPEGAFSGMSYQIISEMVNKEIIVDLYDPHDVDISYKVGTVTYNHHRSEKVICKDDVIKYKLLLDDAWVPGRARDWDPDALFFHFKHFSVKSFPGDGLFNHLIYQQAFLTLNRERRCTNHRLKYHYRENAWLGECGGCLELKHMLRGEYKKSFYVAFMEMHERNCITRKKRPNLLRLDKRTGDKKWYEVKPFEVSNSIYWCMPWDRFDGFDVIYPQIQKLRDKRILFSSRLSVLDDIYFLSIVLVKENGKYYVNRSKDVLPEYFYYGDGVIDIMKDSLVYKEGTKGVKKLYNIKKPEVREHLSPVINKTQYENIVKDRVKPVVGKPKRHKVKGEVIRGDVKHRDKDKE